MSKPLPGTDAVPLSADSDTQAACVRARFTIDRVRVSGLDSRAREEIALLTRHHERLLQRDEDSQTQDLRDIEFITSQLADREMRVNDVVPTARGTFTVTRTFLGGGAYVALLQDQQGRSSPKLVCRGTAFRGAAAEGYSSGLNNVLVEMGARGVRTLWPAILQHVRSEGIGELEVMGKSMGGACAQHLSILLECVARVTVTRLITCCSVGVGAPVNALFIERVLKRRDAPFRIMVVRNGGDPSGHGADYIPTLGGEHLGVGTTQSQCAIDVYYLTTSDMPVTYPRKDSMGTMARRFVGSFWAPHCRQNTLGEHVRRSLVARRDVDEHLRMGTWLEPWRQRIASTISWGWKRFNPTPLADYIEESTKEAT